MSPMHRIQGSLAVAACGAVMPAAASAATTTFSNTTAITPGDLDNAPQSDITVTGLTGVVTDVNVFINGFSHTNPDDIEALLEAPFGQTTVLMNDAGGTDDISNLDFIVNDQGIGPMPNATTLASVPYEPTDHAMQPGLEPFIAPAPPPPYGLTLSLSQGTDPNGVWTLYVDDDVFNTFTGSIAGGWALQITTTDVPPPTVTPTVTPTVLTPTTTAKKKCGKKKRLVGKKCKKKKRKK